MSSNGPQTKTFHDIVGQIRREEILRDPAQALTAAGIDFNTEQWAPQVNRLKVLPEFLQDLEILQSLETKTPDERRKVFKVLAQRYVQFVGWEGITAEEPGW